MFFQQSIALQYCKAIFFEKGKTMGDFFRKN